jgi:integrase
MACEGGTDKEYRIRRRDSCAAIAQSRVFLQHVANESSQRPNPTIIFSPGFGVAHRWISTASKTESSAQLWWVGFHGFRRGLATILSAHVHPRIIAGILRHAGMGTTLLHYIKTSPRESRAALAKLEERVLAREQEQKANLIMNPASAVPGEDEK